MPLSMPSLWELILTVAVVLSTAVTIFMITLPPSYSHFHPGYIAEDDFNDDDRQHEERSGYDYYKVNKDDKGRLATKTTVQVVVLGDLGHSPRMQYHALSLAKHGAGVQLIGYLESALHPHVEASKFIKVVAIDHIPAVLRSSSRVIFPIVGPLKAIFQAWALYKSLAYKTKASRFMLVQNPPSIPVLAVAAFVCFFRNTSLVIDWHNFGYSILALKLGDKHSLVRISRWYEGFFSRTADLHFTVTDAMRHKVMKDFGISATTLHDRPASQFVPFTTEQRDVFLRQCQVTASEAIALHAQTCRLVVSSTSWTADEDFDVLLRALADYAASVKTQNLPQLLVVITGKGPMKQHYQQKISELDKAGKLGGVSIKLAWLSIEDYAAILAAADLGISLHTSSSGVDLPMKVLDMFGAGLPVAGWSKYESWPELVREGVNGLGFESSDELLSILTGLFSQQDTRLSTLRQGALEAGQRRWDDEWDKIALKIFQYRR